MKCFPIYLIRNIKREIKSVSFLPNQIALLNKYIIECKIHRDDARKFPFTDLFEFESFKAKRRLKEIAEIYQTDNIIACIDLGVEKHSYALLKGYIIKDLLYEDIENTKFTYQIIFLRKIT
jgi:hypothetical protein